MKKIFLTAFCTAIAFCYTATAQTNLQIFYDFGDDRQNVTTTLEGYYSDKWGDTFFFIDYDFNAKKNGVPGSYGSYFEIARGLNFWQNSAAKDLSAHVEMNAGVNFGNINWLFGAKGLHFSGFAEYHRIDGEDIGHCQEGREPCYKLCPDFVRAGSEAERLV